MPILNMTIRYMTYECKVWVYFRMNGHKNKNVQFAGAFKLLLCSMASSSTDIGFI